MEETRAMVIKAMTTLENHIASCDLRYEEVRDKQEKTLKFLESIYGQMSAMKEQMAEARGAAKMVKIIMCAAVGVAGFWEGFKGYLK